MKSYITTLLALMVALSVGTGCQRRKEDKPPPPPEPQSRHDQCRRGEPRAPAAGHRLVRGRR
jgi:hypothetical protein